MGHVSLSTERRKNLSRYLDNLLINVPGLWHVHDWSIACKIEPFCILLTNTGFIVSFIDLESRSGSPLNHLTIARLFLYRFGWNFRDWMLFRYLDRKNFGSRYSTSRVFSTSIDNLFSTALSWTPLMSSTAKPTWVKGFYLSKRLSWIWRRSINFKTIWLHNLFQFRFSKKKSFII